jgi:F-type H+-transporting ATPase subunit b
MDILKNFGFDPVLLVAQIVNFLIIFYLLKRFLYKPVLDMLKKRSDTIAGGLKQAEEARLTMEKSLEQEKIILSKAQDEAKKITESAKEQALAIAKEMEDNAKRQTEKMLLEARAQINQDAKATEQRLSEKISILAADMITKTLTGVLGEKEQKKIAEETIKQIKKVD